jgi:SPP1 gp7 family putative phage head morphogenesis protein
LAQRDINVGFRFDGRNVDATEHAELYAARYVTRVSEETKQAIRTLVVRGFRDGVTPYETAKLIRSVVGLDSPRAAALASYYQRLKESGTDADTAQRLADKYGAKLLKDRALTIARTETMGALNLGSLEQARQRTAAGVLRNTQKTWSITPDEKTCRVCRPLAGKTVPLEAQFPGGVMAPPRHPRCRCSLTYKSGPEEQPAVSPADQSLDHLKEVGVDVKLPTASAFDEMVSDAAEIWRTTDVAARGRLVSGTMTALEEARAAFQHLGLDPAEPLALRFQLLLDEPATLAKAGTSDITVNLLNQSWRSLAAMEAKRGEMVTRRWWPDGIAQGHALVHEYAHVLHPWNGALRTWAQVRDQIGIASPVALAHRVSGWAAQGPREFVAEAYMAQVYGRQLEPAVLEMYVALGGPPL